jgi:ketosteroid isomerase-like protein
MTEFTRRYLLGVALLSSVGASAFGQAEAQQDPSLVRNAYKQLIDAENSHDLNAVSALVLESHDTLFVAKAPVGWKGYWGKEDVMQHFHDLYQHPFRIDPDYTNEKIVFPAPGVAETYVPVNITAVYGNFPKPAPFIMVLLWVSQNGTWKMATDIPIPIPPEANKPSPDK